QGGKHADHVAIVNRGAVLHLGVVDGDHDGALLRLVGDPETQDQANHVEPVGDLDLGLRAARALGQVLLELAEETEVDLHQLPCSPARAASLSMISACASKGTRRPGKASKSPVSEAGRRGK